MAENVVRMHDPFKICESYKGVFVRAVFIPFQFRCANTTVALRQQINKRIHVKLPIGDQASPQETIDQTFLTEISQKLYSTANFDLLYFSHLLHMDQSHRKINKNR